MVIRRRTLLLSSAASAVPSWAVGQCVTDTVAVDACRGGVYVGGAPSLDLNFTGGVLDPRIVFTRAAGPATYFDAAGVLQSSAYNLIRNNTQVGAVAGAPGTLPTFWNVATPDGLTTNIVAASADYIDIQIVGTPTGTSYAVGIESAITTSGLPYVLSGWTAVVGGATTNITSLRLLAGGTGGVNVAWNTTSTLTRVAAPWTAAGTSVQPQIAFTTVISSPVNITLRLGLPQLEQAAVMSAVATPTTGAANGAPRFDYDPVTHAAKGLLIEEARTNLWLQSADASNAVWARSGTPTAPTVTANQTTAPDGTLSAARVAFPAVSGAGNGSILYQNLTATAAAYSFSMWMRGNVGGEQISLMNSQNTTTWVSSPATLTTAWQRFTFVTPTLTAATYFFLLGTDLRDGTQTSKAAQTIFVWGGQVELGTFPTSTIPTTSAAATRPADQASMSTLASWFNSVEGTTCVDCILPNIPATATQGGIIRIDDGTSNNYGVLFQSIGNVLTVFGSVAAVQQINNTVGAVPANNTLRKVAWSYGASAWRGAINGVVGTTGPGLLGLPATRMLIGSTGSTGATWMLNGWISGVRYWPRALSATELQAVTT